VASWKRPAELLADYCRPAAEGDEEAVAASPFVFQLPDVEASEAEVAAPAAAPAKGGKGAAPPAAEASSQYARPGEPPNAVVAPASGPSEARRAVLWLASCMQLVALHASRLATGAPTPQSPEHGAQRAERAAAPARQARACGS
jgi:hypothetical protein